MSMLTTSIIDNGQPRLNAALEANDEDAAEALLDNGADPNDVDEYDAQNALHMAASKGCRLPLFCRILDRIHDVNTCDHLRTTALMLASMGNHLEMVVALMKHPKIKLNKRDYRNNRTALHHAVYSNNPTIVTQLLSDKKINTFAKDKGNDNTPLQAAIVNGFDVCAGILRKHGAPEEWRSFHHLKMIHPCDSKLWLASTGTRVPKVSKGCVKILWEHGEPPARPHRASVGKPLDGRDLSESHYYDSESNLHRLPGYDSRTGTTKTPLQECMCEMKERKKLRKQAREKADEEAAEAWRTGRVEELS